MTVADIVVTTSFTSVFVTVTRGGAGFVTVFSTVTFGPAIDSVGPGTVSVTLTVVLSSTVAVTALVITDVAVVVTGAATCVDPHPTNAADMTNPTNARRTLISNPFVRSVKYARRQVAGCPFE